MAHQQVCLRSIYCPWLPCLSQNSPRCACSCRDVGSQEHRSLRHVQVIGVYAFVIGMGVSFLFVTQSAHGTRFRRHSPMPWRGPSAYSGPASPDRLSSSRGICPHGSLGGLDVVQGLPSVHVHIVGIMAVRSSSDTALCFASLPPPSSLLFMLLHQVSQCRRVPIMPCFSNVFTSFCASACPFFYLPHSSYLVPGVFADDVMDGLFAYPSRPLRCG